RWSKEETEKLQELIDRYGEDNMQQVASVMGSRTARQCLERWRWQLNNPKTGRFSKEEGERILEAVAKYGENFAVVAKVTGVTRTPRHISQHYHNVLAPDIDRSEWTLAEEEQVYKTCLKHGRDMLKVQQELGSKRSKRDMWNHFN
ncbi:Homeodomain-like DNA binding domain-containing transcription factor, partial [Mucor lusitanicus CBS 277.49]